LDLSYSADISKYYLLGLGHRGQNALRRFDVWNDVKEASVPVVGRKDWSPGKSAEEDGVVRLSSEKLVETRVLARDKLVGVLLEVIKTRYSDVIELKHGYQVDPMSFGDNEGAPVKLSVSQCIPINNDAEECSIDSDNVTPTIITTDFLVGADGAARTIANAMEINDVQRKSSKPFKVKRFIDDNQRVYKSIPISFPKHWPSNLNYSARSTGNRAALEALPSDAKGNYCALLLLRPDDELARAECDPKVLREFFDQEYPQFSPLIGDEVMRDVASKGASALPAFRFAGPRLHECGRTVILGDAVHTVKPYYGLGANTALEDVSILSDMLTSTPTLSNAVEQFTKQRAADSKALVTISRSMDRPGKIGTMKFILPLILDSMFHKMAPKIFDPSIFSMFQMDGVGFREIQLRKRKDRVLQTLVISSGMSLFGLGVKYAIKSLSKATGLKDVVVGSGMFGTLVLVGLVKNMIAKATKRKESS
jgi:2-polyprenyl-6-methoxyphenol hydroxylase-like FAD-dependent oxidoreductase